MYSQPAHFNRRRLALSALPCHIKSMPLPDLTEDEHAKLVRLLREAIAAEPYRIGPRMSKDGAPGGGAAKQFSIDFFFTPLCGDAQGGRCRPERCRIAPSWRAREYLSVCSPKYRPH
jgi:hypothetical protein